MPTQKYAAIYAKMGQTRCRGTKTSVNCATQRGRCARGERRRVGEGAKQRGGGGGNGCGVRGGTRGPA